MRIIEICCPAGKNIKFYLVKVPHSRDISIYESVDAINKEKINSKFVLKKVKKKIPLDSIVNLHNNNGIESLKRIKSMIKAIKSGKDIYSDDGLPNIKLVKSKCNKLILFDGHHTLLAYMAMGKKFLHEVPNIIIRNKTKYISDKEISIFFGEHAEKSDWRKHVINWLAPKEKQLCKRAQKNMKELLEAIKDKL